MWGCPLSVGIVSFLIIAHHKKALPCVSFSAGVQGNPTVAASVKSDKVVLATSNRLYYTYNSSGFEVKVFHAETTIYTKSEGPGEESRASEAKGGHPALG